MIKTQRDLYVDVVMIQTQRDLYIDVVVMIQTQRDIYIYIYRCSNYPDTKRSTDSLFLQAIRMTAPVEKNSSVGSKVTTTINSRVIAASFVAVKLTDLPHPVSITLQQMHVR